MQNNIDDLMLENYNYDIPQELIAQVPIENRSDSKLIILNRKDKIIRGNDTKKKEYSYKIAFEKDKNKNMVLAYNEMLYQKQG